MRSEIFIERANQLIAETDTFFPSQERPDLLQIDKTTFATLGLVRSLYETNEPFSEEITKARQKYLYHHREAFEAHQLMTCVRGVLETIKFELGNGLISSLTSQIEGEIFGDFLSLAKNLISEGHKDSAAVLACGALEDSLKKYAIKNGLNVYDEELTAVINSLKSKGHLKGVQSGVVQSYVKLRNKAFHAQFDKIEIPEVASLIAFVEQFLIQEFQ